MDEELSDELLLSLDHIIGETPPPPIRKESIERVSFSTDGDDRPSLSLRTSIGDRAVNAEECGNSNYAIGEDKNRRGSSTTNSQPLAALHEQDQDQDQSHHDRSVENRSGSSHPTAPQRQDPESGEQAVQPTTTAQAIESQIPLGVNQSTATENQQQQDPMQIDLTTSLAPLVAAVAAAAAAATAAVTVSDRSDTKDAPAASDAIAGILDYSTVETSDAKVHEAESNDGASLQGENTHTETPEPARTASDPASNSPLLSRNASLPMELEDDLPGDGSSLSTAPSETKLHPRLTTHLNASMDEEYAMRRTQKLSSTADSEQSNESFFSSENISPAEKSSSQDSDSSDFYLEASSHNVAESIPEDKEDEGTGNGIGSGDDNGPTSAGRFFMRTKYSTQPAIPCSRKGQIPSQMPVSIGSNSTTDSAYDSFDLLGSDNEQHSQALSFSSEYEDSQSPASGTMLSIRRIQSDNTYQQRLETTLSSRRMPHESHDYRRSGVGAAKLFTMADLEYFDQDFGREAYLEQLGKSVLDSSSAKTFDQYRRSSMRGTNGPKVIKEGWMLKRAALVPSWRKRYFRLRRTVNGIQLMYSKDIVTDDNANSSSNGKVKVIELSSTSRCLVIDTSTSKLAKDFSFRIITSADASGKECIMAASSSFEMNGWVTAIQSAINAGNEHSFEGSSDLQKIWAENGIHGFLIRYGIRKNSHRNHLQTRMLELNFAEHTITNSKRGETLDSFTFDDLARVSLYPDRVHAEGYGVLLEFAGRHRPWPLYLDSMEARDDLYELLQKVVQKEVKGSDIEARCSRLLLKTGFMERRNVRQDMTLVGPHATVKGRLFVCLYENCVVLYAEDADTDARPWYVIYLRGLQVSMKADRGLLSLGRLVLVCESPQECRAWYNAVTAAIVLPQEVIQMELKERVTIRRRFIGTVARLRRLLKAHVKPEVNGPPKDAKTIDMMIRTLWDLLFPGETYTSNADPRWQEVGFQRGGPASDLRSSGLLGLYCLIYFVKYPTGEFQRILDRTRFGVSEGNMKNYPLAIGCINVVAILTELFGFGDAGSHAEGNNNNAMKTFVWLIARSTPTTRTPSYIPPAAKPGVGTPTRAPASVTSSTSSSSSSQQQQQTPRTPRAKSMAEDPDMPALRPLDQFSTWKELVDDFDNHVFEDMFCLVFPILDSLFVEMGAGYMDFGQVVLSFRKRLAAIFDTLPRSMHELGELANEPCTDSLPLPQLGRGKK